MSHPVTLRNALAACLGVVLLSVTVAPPAGADPARPTNYRSTILRVSPPLPPGYALRVVGGDAFLELEVPRGHTASVPDYAQGAGVTRAPYLRFGADGTVERNERSVAAAINRNRYGGGSTGDAPRGRPRWQVVAHHGRYAWHDHRIHWMVPNKPAAIDRNGRVDMGGRGGTWRVDLTIDGTPTLVTGELVLLDAPSPWPWYGLLVVIALALLALTLARVRADRRPPHRALAGALAASSLLATFVGLAQWRAIPDAAGGSPLTALVPLAALVASVVAIVVDQARVRTIALAAAIAALGGWAVLRRQALVRAVLPTSLPFGVDRAATAVALGVAGAGVAILIWRPPTDPVPAPEASQEPS